MQQAVRGNEATRAVLPTLGGGPALAVRMLTILGMAVALGMLAVGAVVLAEARADAWRQAEQASANLVLALERDISRNIQVYDLSLQGAIDALREPGIATVSPGIRHAALFDRAASAEYLGSLLVLNAAGDIIADSTSLEPHLLNFEDRDYFRVHRADPNLGLYVSHPYRSRLRGGDPSIALSRRLPTTDGHFEGVVVGTLRLIYFQDLFRTLNLGKLGTVTLARTDGELLVRQPSQPSDMGRDLSGSLSFKRFLESTTGELIATSAIDGVERSLTFRRIGEQPLVLIVAVSVDEIYAAWRRKAAGIGSIMVLLCGATVVLCLLFRREVQRRLVAEDALRDAAEKLEVIASTDSLTGLSNRRTFESELPVEWKRAIRARGPVALLLMDADWFKAYNDHYGHQAGDVVLQHVARCLMGNIRRPGDLAARYGGEEFVALLPNTDVSGAVNTAERVIRAIEELAVSHEGSPMGRVTVSIGIAVARPNHGELETVLVKRADAALYDAKRGGRARISVSNVEEPAF